MSATLLPLAEIQLLDANGKPLAGGSVAYYIPNTTTFKATWQDPAQTILNTNPIILDGAGRAAVWGAGSYRQIVHDQFGNLVWDQITEDSTAGIIGNWFDDVFLAGTGFTPGTTTSLALTTAPASIVNLFVYFDGVFQTDSGMTITGSTLTFTSPIPVGVTTVTVKEGTTAAIGAPGAGTVTDSSINTGSILYGHVYSWVSSKDYGATGNGTTNDAANLLTANNAAFSANKPLVIAPGNYNLGTSITFTANVYFLPGAKFTVPNAVTLAFSGTLEAPATQQIFSTSGSGLVTVNPVNNPVGYPEWWGAKSNAPATDCSIGINACIVACGITRLQLADYYLAAGNSVLLQIQNKKLSGLGFYEDNTAGTVTRLIMSDGVTAVVVMGPSVPPGSINDYLKGITIEDFCVSRSVVPVISGNCLGVVDRWTLYSQKNNIKSEESMVGFYIENVVQSHCDKLWAFRSTAGSGGGTDSFIGYQLNGSVSIGSGGNASLYMTDCLAGVGGPAPTSTSTGYLLQGSCADTFITRPETSGMGIGMDIAIGTSTSPNFVGVDCQITNPILDSCPVVPLRFNGTTEYGTITILGGYGALASSGSNIACIDFVNSKASVNLVGFQCIMGTSQAGTVGISATNSANITSSCVITECSGEAIILNTVSDSRFDDTIVNYGTGGSPGGAVRGTTVSRCKFNNSVKGTANLWAIGYNMLGSANNYNEWNCTGLNSVVVNTKLILNGVTITVQGVPTTNTTDFVSGVLV